MHLASPLIKGDSMSQTIQDLVYLLIKEEEWREVWAVTQGVTYRGFETCKARISFISPLSIVPSILRLKGKASEFQVLRGAMSPDSSTVMWGSSMRGDIYMEHAVVDMLTFMRCESILKDETAALSPLEIRLIQNIRAEHFFEDVSHFFCNMGLPPSRLKGKEAWIPLPKRKLKPSKSSPVWKH